MGVVGKEVLVAVAGESSLFDKGSMLIANIANVPDNSINDVWDIKEGDCNSL